MSIMKKELNWLYDYEDLKVYQYADGFKFSLDSILLAEYVEIRKKDEKIVDFCTGNAVIPILIQHKYHKKVTGIEIQKPIAQLAIDSVKYNGMEGNIDIIEDNVLNVSKYFPGNSVDVVLCNPPYFKYHSDEHVNQNLVKGIARHELEITLEEIMQMASYLLNSHGRFYLVHIPERLEEIIVYAHQYHLALKKVQFITSKEGNEPVLVLVCLVKDGKYGCKVAPVVCIEQVKTYQNLFHK